MNEEEKTTLQRIIEQKAEQIRRATEQAIDDGANIEHSIFVSNGYTIDGIFVQINPINNITLALDIKSEKIAKACKPSKDELKKMAEKKRAELEEIEKQINAKQ